MTYGSVAYGWEEVGVCVSESACVKCVRRCRVGWAGWREDERGGGSVVVAGGSNQTF